MKDEPKRLPSADVVTTTRTAIDEPVVLPFADGMMTYNRQDTNITQHQSISRELMMVGLQNANAMVLTAQATHAVPAQEKTKQVRAIGLVVVIVAIAAFIAICVKPEAAPSVAAVAGIVVGVFGGMYAVDHLLRKPGSATPPDGSTGNR